ncbi:hypothetical protein AGMMS4952_00880 [Spirochaetia bacterium]|nr:hypothetical protein AGMMS4952_00880 [Spirochaetia bacterium]
MPEKKRTKAKGRLRFFVGQAATAAQRIAYVMRRKPLYNYVYQFFYFTSRISKGFTSRVKYGSSGYQNK